LIAVITVMIAVSPARADAPLVSATIEPAQITLGESAQLTITSTGSGMEAPELPQVPGLEFRVVGQSRRLEIINGATLQSSSIIVRVTPREVGIFTIPGLTPKSQPLQLRVNPDNGPPGSLSSNPPGSSGTPPLTAGGSASNGIRTTIDGSAYLRLVLPKHAIYVGESIPVEIELGLRAGFVTSLNGLPTLTGSEFTLNNLSHQPERAEKLVDGKPFVVLTWHSVIAGVKPGSFSLSVESPLTVKVRTHSPRDSLIDDMLGDPFMQNFFAATVPKDITVTSPPTELTVSALPTEGRPQDFSGAVGNFQISSDLSSTTAAAGDPLTLHLHVTGSGNFDRVDSTMLEHLDRWKTYPPKSAFKPSDPLGFKGEKNFEQPLIASQPGTQTLPGLSFSYFDPATRRYETAHSAPLNVTIAPSAAENSLAAPQAAAAASAAAAPKVPATPTSDGLRPDHAVAQTSVDSLVPLYLQARFLPLPSVLVLAFAGGWLALRRRASDPSRRRAQRGKSKAARRALVQVEAAARSGDTTQFFNSARTTLQHTLGARWHLAPEQVTTAEVEARLGSTEADIRELFALADAARYSGEPPTATDFARWLQIVRRELVGETS
jgi:hypothetical protein